jgi:hypothetical protein
MVVLAFAASTAAAVAIVGRRERTLAVKAEAEAAAGTE